MEKDEEIKFISSNWLPPKSKPHYWIGQQINRIHQTIVKRAEDGVEQNNAKVIAYIRGRRSTIINKIGGMWAVVLWERGTCVP